MAAVVDLTSSPEPLSDAESPTKLFTSFQPRKHKGLPTPDNSTGRPSANEHRAVGTLPDNAPNQLSRRTSVDSNTIQDARWPVPSPWSGQPPRANGASTRPGSAVTSDKIHRNFTTGFQDARHGTNLNHKTENIGTVGNIRKPSEAQGSGRIEKTARYERQFPDKHRPRVDSYAPIAQASQRWRCTLRELLQDVLLPGSGTLTGNLAITAGTTSKAPAIPSTIPHPQSSAPTSLPSKTGRPLSSSIVNHPTGPKRRSDYATSMSIHPSPAKRIRVDDRTAGPIDHSRRNRATKLVDVTDPRLERTSHSDEDVGSRMLAEIEQRHQDAKSRALASSAPTPYKVPWSRDEDVLLKKLKEARGLDWERIVPHFPGRTLSAIQVRYSTKLKGSKGHLIRPTAPHDKSGERYSPEEDALIKKLKEEDGMSFEQIVRHLNGRTAGAITVRYHTKIKTPEPFKLMRSESRDMQDATGPTRSKRQRRSNGVKAGFVPWTALQEGTGTEAESADEATNEGCEPLLKQDCTFPKSLSRALRQRELGASSGGRAWSSSRCLVPDEVKNHCLKDYKLQQYFHGTSGDVVGLSWSSSGKYFAAGSIAITDNQSMQYNMSRNLLVGDREGGAVQELIEHHVPRPVVEESDNVNASSSMRSSQDPRLFLTVTATAFSPMGQREHWLYTAGADRTLRRYSVSGNSLDGGIQHTSHRCVAQHSASVDLLAVHADGLVATGCHAVSNSISVYMPRKTGFQHEWTGSPKQDNPETKAPIFPSSLKWGEATAHKHLLLAGFSGDEDKLIAGETALWDMFSQQRIEVRGTTRNVFDVAWNPLPSSTSTAFAVASNSYGLTTGKRCRTAIRCFAPTEKGLQSTMTWECPALDINDLVICPHDSNLIAAGATDCKVYIWDQRFVNKVQKPLHVLCHGETLNVLPHHLDRELTDTGVRFLCWGATKSRLYSGSSDGIVKVWNPYRAPDNAHVDDIMAPRQHRSAIMSGVFNTDQRELLVGTENGRINLFTTSHNVTCKPRPFKLYTAPAPTDKDEDPFEAARRLVMDGKIQYRPCGAMPMTQAVQGPAYDGPYQMPTPSETSSAELRLQSALIAQNDLTSTLAQQGDFEPDNAALDKAQLRVREAQRAIEDLQERHDFATTSRPHAEAFQQSLAQADLDRNSVSRLAEERFGTRSEPCAIDACTRATVAPRAAVDDDDRSALRIPGTLRRLGRDALAAARLEEEEDDDGALPPCSSCFPAPSRSSKARRTLCVSCQLRGMRLSGECGKCAGPARVRAGGDSVCDSCAFPCFRCAQPAVVSNGARLVVCESCCLTWEAGALGYDLLDDPLASATVARRRGTAGQGEDDHDHDHEDIGLNERDHYALRWEVTQQMDMY